MSAAAIEAENLTKTYRTGRHRSIEALRGLSFEVPAGSVFGLLGPNGAGKSTTTKILTTLSLPSSGTARVTGADVVRDAATVRTRIGYVSQGASTDPLLTVRENLELAARLRAGTPAVMGRVQDGTLLLDLRAVFERQEEDLIAAIRRAAA